MQFFNEYKRVSQPHSTKFLIIYKKVKEFLTVEREETGHGNFVIFAHFYTQSWGENALLPRRADHPFLAVDTPSRFIVTTYSAVFTLVITMHRYPVAKVTNQRWGTVLSGSDPTGGCGPITVEMSPFPIEL